MVDIYNTVNSIGKDFRFITNYTHKWIVIYIDEEITQGSIYTW